MFRGKGYDMRFIVIDLKTGMPDTPFEMCTVEHSHPDGEGVHRDSHYVVDINTLEELIGLLEPNGPHKAIALEDAKQETMPVLVLGVRLID